MDIKNLINGLGEKKEELIKNAAQCKSKEELLILAKENGVALSELDAAELFASMHIKLEKLSDDELDSVAGGDGQSKPRHETTCEKCGASVIAKETYSGLSVYRCKICNYYGQCYFRQ